MKLFIIGNGFDLNHGLPTSYYNYRDYLWNNAPGVALRYEYCPNMQSAECSKDTKWNDVEYGLRLHYEDAFADIGENYYPDMGSERTPGWEDIKIETDNRFSFLQDFTKGYFYNWIQGAELFLQDVTPKYQLNPSDAYITFNYTRTLEVVYSIPTTNIYHIHGQVGIPESIQFGNPSNNPKEIQNSLEHQYDGDEFYSVIFEPAVDVMSKYARAAYKYLEGNNEGLNYFVSTFGKFDEVIIMGHTLLGIDDLYYERVLVPYCQNCLWTFYVHSEEDKRRADDFVEEYQLGNCRVIEW